MSRKFRPATCGRWSNAPMIETSQRPRLDLLSGRRPDRIPCERIRPGEKSKESSRSIRRSEPSRSGRRRKPRVPKNCERRFGSPANRRRFLVSGFVEAGGQMPAHFDEKGRKVSDLFRSVDRRPARHPVFRPAAPANLWARHKQYGTKLGVPTLQANGARRHRRRPRDCRQRHLCPAPSSDLLGEA